MTAARALDRDIVALALPALGALAADPLVSLVDTAFVGRLGAAELGALGVASAVFAVAFFVFNFLAYGTTPLVARAIGAGDREEAGRIVVAALATAGLLGVATLIVLEAAAVPVLALMGATGDVADAALAYLRIRALAIPAVLVALAGHGAFRGYQDTRTPMVVALGLSTVNLVLDPLLIFGAGWGIAGAAWATVVAQWAGAAAFLVLLLGKRRTRLGIALVAPGLVRVRRFFSIGRDLVVRTAALVATLTLATAVATRVGTVAVAAHQVTVQLWVFLALVIDALAIAAQALMGRYLGEGSPATARAAATRLFGWGLAGGLLLSGVMLALGGVLPGWFSDDADVAARVREVYPFVVLMQPLNALVFVGDGVVMGVAGFRYLAGATVAAGLAAAGVLAAVLPLDWGLAGVWWGITAMMAVRAGALGWWWRSPRTALPAG